MRASALSPHPRGEFRHTSWPISAEILQNRAQNFLRTSRALFYTYRSGINNEIGAPDYLLGLDQTFKWYRSSHSDYGLYRRVDRNTAGLVDNHTWKRASKARGKPSRAVFKLHHELPRGLGSFLIQMRTGKTGLRKYLHGQKVPEISTSICQCGQAPQSVTHVLVHRRKFSQIRRKIWKEEEKNHAWRSIAVKEMLSSPHYAKKAALFMRKTGLLGQFKAVRTEIDNTNVTGAFWGENKM